MDVLRSLYTVGCLVRTPDDRHGAIFAFDARTNVAKIQFGAGGPFANHHFAKLRAGNDETEQAVTGCVTRDFPKLGWSTDDRRVLARPDYRTGRIG